MPFPMKIQPIDSFRSIDATAVKPSQPVLKNRLKRLFDRPFTGVLKISNADKTVEKDTGTTIEFEPSTVCLDKMVRNFIEDNNNSNEKHTVANSKYGRNRCNCFNGNSIESSDDELDFFSDSVTPNSSFFDPTDTLKSLVPCASVMERNLLADTSKIVEMNNKLRRDDLRKTVADILTSLGYNASVCKSKWEKTSSIPAGEYEYIDVLLCQQDGTECERLIVDVDFRSEFEIARSTSSYKAVLQCIPSIFVGKSERLLQILSIVSEAARTSLKKKGMHVAPWRKSEYMKSKWLSPYTRSKSNEVMSDQEVVVLENEEEEVGELDLIFGESEESEKGYYKDKTEIGKVVTWQLPAVKPKSLDKGNNSDKKMVTGLASLLKDKL